MKNKQLFGIIVILLVGVGLFSASRYNKLMTKETEVESQWANVESKLQRRADLIPNLVNTVKGSMAHEKEIFSSISQAREKLAGAESLAEVSIANAEMENSLSRLLVVMESYPELTSNENIRALMDQLEGSENRISVERDRYNEAVKDYNKAINHFPDMIFAKVSGFKRKEFFKADKGTEQVPIVDLDTSSK